MKTLSVRQWAKKHNVPLRNAYHWINTGKLTSVRIPTYKIHVPEDATPPGEVKE